MELPPLTVVGDAGSTGIWGKMQVMGAVRSTAGRAEQQAGAPGSGRLPGAVTAGSSLAWLLLTALTCTAQRTESRIHRPWRRAGGSCVYSLSLRS